MGEGKKKKKKKYGSVFCWLFLFPGVSGGGGGSWLFGGQLLLAELPGFIYLFFLLLVL